MHRFKISITLSILSLVLSTALLQVAQAQQVRLQKSPQSVQVSQAEALPDNETVVHRTLDMMRSEEGQAALQEVWQLKELGMLSKGRNQSSTALIPGTEKTFRVQDFTNGNQFFDETFTLVVSETRFNLWIANTELASNGGKLVESDWLEFSEALGNSTPQGSWNPSMGIIEIDEAVYGPPSDVDGNGKVEVLVHDIKDGYDPSNGLFTAGYFQPADLSASASGNGADIIHLDTYPSIYNSTGARRPSEFVLQTLAHEYQHLIFAFNKNSNDLTFINEGLSEWAEVVNGYTPRTITYLNEAGEISRSLLSWRDNSGEPYGGPESQDYQRGGLFHHYLAERLGTEIVGGISRSNATGATNYSKMLTDLGLDASFMRDVVQGFHVANLINDQTLNPAYGYDSAFRSGVRASGFSSIDGTQTSSSQTSGNLNSGSARYVNWSQVGSFTIEVTASSGANRLMPVLLYKPAFGTMQRAFPEVGGEPLTISGDFEEVYLILPHVDLTTSATASYDVLASWNDFAGTSQFESVAYELGEAATNSGNLIGYGLGGGLTVSLPVETEFANVFNIPEGGALSSVDVSMLFFDNLSAASPTSSVRDFTLKVYADQDGEPGELILSKQLAWSTGITTPDLSYQTVDLSGDLSVLENHQGRIYVSLSDAGTDDNHIFLPMVNSTSTDPDSPSFMYFDFSNSGLNWASFDQVQDANGNSVFDGHVVPIRATINLIGGATDVESDETLPRSLTLQQNYPNPFNPSTNIRFNLPGASDVQLEVYDLLGRNVATLVNGTLPAGQHEVSFDASDLTSGLYLYTITTGSQRISRTMTLIK